MLPRLPSKARPRWEHLGFREQGTDVADKRIEALEAEIRALEEKEETLKREQDEISRTAGKERDDAISKNRAIQQRLRKANDPDIGSLQENLANRFKETESALKLTLDNLDLGEIHQKMKEILQEPGKQSPLVVQKKLSWVQKKLTQSKKKKDELTKKKAILAKNLEELDTELKALNIPSEPKEESSDSDSWASSRTRPMSPDRDLDIGEKLEQLKEDSRKQRQRLEKKKAELHKVEKLKKASEISTKLETERLKEEKCQSEISGEYREIKRLEKELKDLKKKQQEKKDDDKDEESQVENEIEILLRKDTQEYEEMAEQDVREKELREVRDLVLSKRAPHRALRREEREHRRTTPRWARERRPVSHLGHPERLQGFDALPRGMREVLDLDDSDSTNDEAEDPSRQRFLDLLELMIKSTEDLETQIRMILEHREEMSRVADMKHILHSEMKLERKWLEHVKAHSTLEPGGSCSDSPKHNHLLGERVTDKIDYEDLEGENFRVLILLPAPEPHYPLICKLETWPLNGRGETQQYAALSYFWGSEGHNGRIYFLGDIDDEPSVASPERWGSAARRATSVRIRNNLFRALLRLRSHGKGAQKVALWVDFLCINQENSVEKTQQLSRMVNIYSSAGNVCIWLGESDREKRSDEAMAFIPTLMDFAVFDRHANDRKQARKWYALGELMRDRWFSRRWIVQEIALARDATVHCGGAIVRWSDFADAASLLVSNQETIKSLFDFSDWREGPNTLGNIEAFGASILLEATNNLFLRKHNGDIKRPIKSIESLVTYLKTFDTSDQRDLIYSLKCIASDTSKHLWQRHKDGHDHLPADYSKSEIEVYKDFTEFCVKSSHSLDIICRPWAMPVKGGKALPSWIPLLSSSEFGLPDEIYSGRKNGEVLVGQAGQPNYAASSQKPCEVQFKHEPQDEDLSTKDKEGNGSARREVLHAWGFRLAKIKDVSARNTGGVITKESLGMGKWRGFRKDTDSVPDPIWRTLVADRSHNGQVPPSWYQRACLRCLEIADVFNNGDLNIGEILQGHSEMLRKYLTRVRNVTWNRTFFTATVQHREGPLFGLCPPKSKEGDFVCILYGCSVPVVMRESSSGRYMTLIGEAYVHGKMDGEALEDFEEGRIWGKNGESKDEAKDEEFAII
ncbi:hypothetical protein CEP54_005312 [Fusarium duplospermum]|uniref:Heterokaryon incompatibility domain-containing protein n=1 Tax=Fusarium duplospermum TaxID=1325734 RepID=A0A428QD53_9HYPO|nr:hypothetical protein CEP54_005312 [Fusarium duplospermum]